MIPSWVAPYIGVPYKDRGRDLGGLDCYGLLYHAYRNVLKVNIQDLSERYTTAKDTATVAALFLEETSSTRWRRVRLDVAVPPDVLEFSLIGEPHVGLLVTRDRFLHVLTGRETCVERLYPHWAPRVTAAYRHEAMDLA